MLSALSFPTPLLEGSVLGSQPLRILPAASPNVLVMAIVTRCACHVEVGPPSTVAHVMSQLLCMNCMHFLKLTGPCGSHAGYTWPMVERVDIRTLHA